MECITEPNIFAFGIPPIKVIAPIGKHSDRTIECENVLGCICGIGARRGKQYTHYIGDWQSLIFIFY